MTNVLLTPSFEGRTGEERLICGDEQEEKRRGEREREREREIDGRWVGNLRGSRKDFTKEVAILRCCGRTVG
jgi:hypothetical protein